MNETIQTGSCLCKNISYHTIGQPFCTEYCHCKTCQKSVGSVVVTWMDFKSEQVSWTNKQPQEYQSSQHVFRGFCPQCGTSITFRDERHPEYITISIATLDNAELFKPTQHIFTESAVSWLDIDDDCQRYLQKAQKTWR